MSSKWAFEYTQNLIGINSIFYILDKRVSSIFVRYIYLNFNKENALAYFRYSVFDIYLH